MKGPSNEWWFDKWVAHLTRGGVTFHWQTALEALDYDGEQITGARVALDTRVQADIYVLANTPFSAAEIVAKNPRLLEDRQLAKLQPLIQDGPHTQVSFRIALTDSPFNITLFAHEQSWPSKIDLGKDISSLWTCTASVASVPGRVHGKPLRNCTKEEFVDEVLAQIYESEVLDLIIKKGNDGHSLRDFPILTTEVWHEWHFSPNGITPDQPKWVTTTNTQPHRPSQATSIPNLVLAGAHTKTEADIWSIEGAVESGRRAAKVYEPDVVVKSQHKPLLLKVSAFLDDGLFALGEPHILKVAAAVSIVAGLFYFI